MLEVQRLSELEGADGSETMGLFAEEGPSDGGRADVADDNDTCEQSFRVLRMLVQNWFVDVVRKDNPFADQLLVHFYRWVCSSSSLSHEPAVRGMLHRLMSKVFVRLVGEFERLGCVIVYADFNRLIISTNQTSLEAATGYMDYIVNTVQSNPLFNRITLQATKYWSSLLFMDRVNYGGVMLHQVDHSTVQPAAPQEEGGQGGQGGQGAAATSTPEGGDVVMKDVNDVTEITATSIDASKLITGLEDSDDDDEEMLRNSHLSSSSSSSSSAAAPVQPRNVVEDTMDKDGNLANFIVDELDDEEEYGSEYSDEEEEGGEGGEGGGDGRHGKTYGRRGHHARNKKKKTKKKKRRRKTNVAANSLNDIMSR